MDNAGVVRMLQRPGDLQSVLDGLFPLNLPFFLRTLSSAPPGRSSIA